MYYSNHNVLPVLSVDKLSSQDLWNLSFCFHCVRKYSEHYFISTWCYFNSFSFYVRKLLASGNNLIPFESLLNADFMSWWLMLCTCCRHHCYLFRSISTPFLVSTWKESTSGDRLFNIGKSWSNLKRAWLYYREKSRKNWSCEVGR